jgi:alpha-galactosidase/6-phospho-beta-glucosidase family protein
VIEVKAVIGAGGARPIAIGELPPQAARWTLAQVYAHELTVDAAIEGSRQKALQALACDPMIRDFREAQRVFDAIVKGQGPRLRAFRRR